MFMLKDILDKIIFEPTCAYCMMGSYALLSDCLSLDNKSQINRISRHRQLVWTTLIYKSFIQLRSAYKMGSQLTR